MAVRQALLLGVSVPKCSAVCVYLLLVVIVLRLSMVLVAYSLLRLCFLNVPAWA